MNRSTAKWIQSTIQCRQCFNRVPQSEVHRDFRCRACHRVTAIFPNGESNRARRGHEFVPGALLAGIPGLYETEDTPLAEKMLHIHYFIGGCDWYIAELDPETGRAFSYCPCHPGEWGYVNLVEMEEVSGAMSVFERDLYFKPTTTRELGSA